MKFLVLALCVCAAISASFGQGRHRAYNPLQNPVAAPAVAPVAVAAAAPFQAAKQVVNKAYSSNDGQAAILRSESNVSPDGFQYNFETENGISAESTGAYKQVGDAGGVVHQGFYRYTTPEGIHVYVTYTADENGYQAQGDALPVGPPIPEAILRSIAYNAAHSKDSVQKY